MQDFLQLLIGGLASGAIYALVAAGFTLLWQTARTVNFAQGEFAILPSFIVLMAMNLGLPVWAAILVGLAVAAFVLGALFKVMLVDPIARHGAASLAIATVALGLLLHEWIKSTFGAEARPLFRLVGQGVLDIRGVAVAVEDLAVIAVAGVAILLFLTFLGDTRTGRAIQAVAQNATAARVIGVRVDRMILYAFVLNALLAGIASVLIGLPAQARLADGPALTVVAFAAAVLGAFSLRGAIAGAMVLGMIEHLAAAFVASSYRDAIPPLILIAVVAIRPRGLFGRPEERTA